MIKNSLLDHWATTYRKSSPQDDMMRELVVHTFRPFLYPDRIGLELGCSDGYMTAMLAQHLKHIDVVEGSGVFIEKAKSRLLTNVQFHHCLFEEFTPPYRYGFIFASYILTHIEDKTPLFNMVKAALEPDGLLFVVVPNARVLSRQLALHMGLIKDLKALTENDHNHGHVRAYDRVALNNELEQAGFSIIAQGGIMLKPLADFQMDELVTTAILGKTQLEGLYKLGLEYPDLCSALYCVCRKD